MSIIGNPIISTDFPKDTFSGNGSTTAFTMAIAPASVNAVIVVVSGITQDPSTYTISGTTLTFSAAPPSGTSNISVRHLGVAGTPNTPSAGSVVTASIADSNVTTAKIADANITQAKLASNVAGTGPAFWVYGNTNQVIASATYTKVILNTELFDTNNNFDTTNYRFTPTVAGFYQVNAVCEAYAAGSTITAGFGNLYKNGTLYSRGSAFSGSQTEYYGHISTLVYMNGTTDYLELYMYVASGGTITLYGSDFYKNFNACLIKAA